MGAPPLIDVIKCVRHPLLLQHAVPLLANVQRFSAPEFSVFLPMYIQIYGTPEAKAMSPNDNNHRGIDQQEYSCAGTTVLGMQNTFTVILLLAAKTLQADKCATD